MATTSDTPLWETVVYVLAAMGTMGLIIYGIFKKVYMKGQGDQIDKDKIMFLENKIILLEKQVQDIRSDYDTLNEDIKEYRKEVKDTLVLIEKNQTEMKEALAFIRGKMSKRDKTTSS